MVDINKKIELLNVSELCDILGICSNTAYYLLNTEQIKAIRVGRIWKIPLYALEYYIDSNSKMNQITK